MEESTRPIKVKDQAQLDELIADPGRLVVVAFVAPWYVIWFYIALHCTQLHKYATRHGGG